MLEAQGEFEIGTFKIPPARRDALLSKFRELASDIRDTPEIIALVIATTDEAGDFYNEALDHSDVLKAAMECGGSPFDGLTIKAAHAYASACERGRAEWQQRMAAKAA